MLLQCTNCVIRLPRGLPHLWEASPTSPLNVSRSRVLWQAERRLPIPDCGQGSPKRWIVHLKNAFTMQKIGDLLLVRKAISQPPILDKTIMKFNSGGRVFSKASSRPNPEENTTSSQSPFSPPRNAVSCWGHHNFRGAPPSGSIPCSTGLAGHSTWNRRPVTEGTYLWSHKHINTFTSSHILRLQPQETADSQTRQTGLSAECGTASSIHPAGNGFQVRPQLSLPWSQTVPKEPSSQVSSLYQGAKVGKHRNT